MDKEGFREEEVQERPYDAKLDASPAVADFGEYQGYVKIIRSLWHYGWTNIADLARRTKISGPQTRACLLRLRDSDIVECVDSQANKRSSLWNIKHEFRNLNPTFVEDIQEYHNRYVDQRIVEAIKVKRWYSIEDLKANVNLQRIVRKNNLSWKDDVGSILNSDDFYRKDGQVARRYGAYGRVIKIEEIKVYKKRAPRKPVEKLVEKLEDEGAEPLA